MLLLTRNWASKQARRCAAALMLAALLLPSGLMALPVAVEQVTDKVSLRQAAFFLVDGDGRMSILEASAPLGQSRFTRLEDGLPVAANGVLWLRFSLIKNNVALSSLSGENSRQLLLDLGPGTSGARLYVAESVTTDGEVKEWREFLPTFDGRFELPEPEILPLTVYVRLDGIPSLWFDPVLLRDSQEHSPFTWTLFMQIALGLALAVVLIRGMSENAEWRFWAGAILACMMIPALFGQYGSESRLIYFTAVPRLLAPGLALMLMPHLGRYLLNSRGSKALDGTLVALSVPGVLTALAPLIPGLGWTARLLPLSPLLLLPLILLAALRVRRGQSGALLYLLFCLFPFIGALLALLPLISGSFPLLAELGPNLTIIGYLAAGVIVALARPSAEAEKGDFFPLNSFLEDGIFTEVSRNGLEQPGKKTVEESADLIVERLIPEQHNGSESAAADLSELMDIKGGEAAQTPKEKATLPDLAALLDPGLQVAEKDDENPEALQEEAGLTAPQESEAHSPTTEDSPPSPLQNVADILDSLNAPKGTAAEVVEDATELTAEPNDTAPSEAPFQSGSEPYLPAQAEPAAAASLKRTEDIIYINDEEEPGLVILKPKGSAPIEGIAASGQHPAPNWEYTAISRLENALRAPYEQLLAQLEDLKERQNLASEHADELERSLGGLGLMLDNLERVARGEPLSGADSQTVFNLSQLIRRIHDELLPQAEERGLTLSWFVAPGLPTHFKGREQELTQAIRFLLHGTIDGAASGAVQLTVRAGSGPYEGQIQFSLLESGLRPSHLKRPSGWLNKAWELAASSGGSFNIDFIPDKGMAITLALPLVAVLEATPEPPADPLDLPGSAALADFAPGPEPEGADEPLPGLSLDDDEDVLLLTDAIIPTPASSPSVTEPVEDLAGASQAEKGDVRLEEITQSALSNGDAANLGVDTAKASAAAYTHGLGTGSSERADTEPAAQFMAEQESAPQEEPINVLLEPETMLAASSSEQEQTASYPSSQNESDRYPHDHEGDDAPLVILSGDDLKDLPFAATASEVTEYDIPASGDADIDTPEAEPAQQGPREYILIADMAASGRRLIARRLEGLPHQLVEARNADEIILGVNSYPVGLLILDADMPEQDVKRALDKIAEYNRTHGLQATPSLCLLSHESQGERLARLGCTESQIKSASRTQFRQAVLRLCPHPKAAPEEMLPESPLLRQPHASAESQPDTQVYQEPASSPEEAPASASGLEASAPKAQKKGGRKAKSAPEEAPDSPVDEKRDERVPLLDMIVASLEDEAPEEAALALSADAEASGENHDNQTDSAANKSPLANEARNETASQTGAEDRENPSSKGLTINQADGPEPKPLKEPYPLSGMSEMMESEMVPLIPGLLVVLQDSLDDLGQARVKPDAELARDVAKRMAGQGTTFGLNTLERMARCLERAAEANDLEAIRDFADELLSLGRRFLAALRQTHEDYQKKN